MRKILLPVIAILIVLVSMIPQPVYAATQTRAVNGALTAFQGLSASYVGGAADYTVLNDNNADTSYARVAAAGSPYYGKVAWPMQAFVLPYSAISNVRVTTVARREGVGGSGVINAQAYISGSWYPNGSNSLGVGYSTIDFDYPNNPNTGIAWTAAEINAASFGFQANSDHIRVTYLYITVTYTAPVAPTVTTDTTDDIASTSATFNGTVTDDGSDTIDYYGFVWDTSDKGDPGNADPSGPPGAWTSGWKSAVGDYGENPFDHATGVVLVKGTTYYVRAAAHNSTSWAYGGVVSFTTIDDPAITTDAASYVASTTARLNANLTDDGGEGCTIQFGWCQDADCAGASCDNWAEIAAAASFADDTLVDDYYTGNLPYTNDPTGLTAATLYAACARATNDASTQEGGIVKFTTGTGVDEPFSFIADTQQTAISLLWIKGDGATRTMVRGKMGSYPANNADGVQVYFDTLNSVTHEDLSPGETWYYRAWGESGTVYSATYAELLATTLPSEADTHALPSPDTPDSWFQDPDHTAMSSFFAYDLLNWWADSFDIPNATFWFMMFMFGAAVAGGGIYKISNKLPLSVIAAGVVMVIGTFAGIISGWLSFPFLVFGVIALVIGERHY